MPPRVSTPTALCTPSRANLVTGDMYRHMWEQEQAANAYIEQIERERKEREAREAQRIDYSRYAQPEQITAEERIAQVYADLNARYPGMNAKPPAPVAKPEPVREPVFVRAEKPEIPYNPWNMMQTAPEPSDWWTLPDWTMLATDHPVQEIWQPPVVAVAAPPGLEPLPNSDEDTIPEWEPTEDVPAEVEEYYQPTHIKPRNGTRTRRTIVTSRTSRKPASAGIPVEFPVKVRR